MNPERPRSAVGVFLIVVVAVVLASPEALAAATCNTFDGNNAPTNAFTGGEKIVVRGTGFAANSIVLVNLLQGNKTTELDRVRANDLGAFVLTDATVPDDVIDGDGAIKAQDARASATCALTLTAGDGSGRSLGGLFLVWGLGLVVFGGVLGLLTYRRWKAERLREAVDSLAWREQYSEREPHRLQEREREPVTVGAGAGSSRVTSAHGTDPLPSWRSDDERPSWTADPPRPSWTRPSDGRPSASGGPRDEPATPGGGESAWTPSWTAPHASRDDDQDGGDAQPWAPPGGSEAERFEEDDDQAPFRPPVQQPVGQRPMPTRPGPSDPWELGDDDLSPLGAPRPFDERFGPDEASNEPASP